MTRSKTRFFAIMALAVVTIVPFAVYAASRSDEDGVSAQIIKGLEGAPGSEQQAALADGRVDDAELQAAVARTIQCLRDAGVTVVALPDDPSGFKYGFTLSPEEQQRANLVYADCYAKHQREVDIAKARQGWRVLSPEEAAAASGAMVSCLVREGVDVPPDAPKPVWWEKRFIATREFATCADEVVHEFGALP